MRPDPVSTLGCRTKLDWSVSKYLVQHCGTKTHPKQWRTPLNGFAVFKTCIEVMPFGIDDGEPDVFG